MPASELLPNPKNWRTHPPEQADAMRGVLAEIGYADAVLARETPEGLMLVDGHLRAEVTPDAIVPVLVLDVNEAEADKILATHDPLAAMAEADQQKLGELLHDVEMDNDAVTAMLEELAAENGVDVFETSEVVEDEAPIDRAMELQEKWGTARGQLWVVEGKQTHRLLCGDSTQAADVERVMGGEKAHMVFTDPPYGVDYNGGMKQRERLVGDHVGTDIYGEALPLVAMHSDDKCALYLWYADGHAAAAAAAAAAAGFVITAQVIWAKNHAQFVTSAHYKGKHEPCYYAHKKGKSARWHGPNNEVTLWEYDRASSNDFHPTQKPVAVAARAIGNSSAEGDIVADVFLGGGTTMVAAEQLGRRCYGIEIEPKYVAVCLERLSALGAEPRLVADGP